VQHIAWDLNTDQVSNLGDLLSRSDLVSLFHGRICLDFSVTRQDVAMIDFQGEGLAIKGIRSANHGAVTDGMNPSAFWKIQIATGMGTEAVVAIRSKGARRVNPVGRGKRRKRKNESVGPAGNIRVIQLAGGVQECVPGLTLRRNETIH